MDLILQAFAEALRPIIREEIKSAMSGANIPVQDDLIFIEEACELLGMKKSSMYVKVSQGEIPCYRKNGKRLIFSKKTLIKYIKDE